MKYDYIIVGAGLFGSVLAERLSTVLDKKILIIEKRNHLGGNCASEIDDETKIEFHRYGTHIFHTSFDKVWKYVCKFTEFNNYHHQVLTTHGGKVYQMPINLQTINSFYGLNLKPSEATMFIDNEIKKSGIITPKNLEEKAISCIGRPLYEAFIKGYTVKQWKKDPTELPLEIISRLPVRFNYCKDYFLNSRWQGLPMIGYQNLFKKMLSSNNIEIELNCDYFNCKESLKAKEKIIYTGPIDQYFEYKHGRLEWLSVKFVKEVVPYSDYQGTSVMNYADLDVEFTRIHEPKHLHPERNYSHQKSLIISESSYYSNEEPCYPVNTARNQKLYYKYKALTEKEKGIEFGGRLGEYAYFDMDKVIMSALDTFKKIAHSSIL